jgi:hypothetical protein
MSQKSAARRLGSGQMIEPNVGLRGFLLAGLARAWTMPP